MSAAQEKLQALVDARTRFAATFIDLFELVVDSGDKRLIVEMDRLAACAAPMAPLLVEIYKAACVAGLTDIGAGLRGFLLANEAQRITELSDRATAVLSGGSGAVS